MPNRFARAALVVAGLVAAAGCSGSSKPSIPADLNQPPPTTKPSTAGGGPPKSVNTAQ